MKRSCGILRKAHLSGGWEAELSERHRASLEQGSMEEENGKDGSGGAGHIDRGDVVRMCLRTGQYISA